ncbi:MAG: hypothetical protein ACRDLB_08790 [Actinomycetota bacterium]
MQTGARDQSIPAALILVGGLLSIIAGFLSWMDFSPEGDPTTTFKGTDLTAGTGTLGFGVVLLILGIVLYVRGRQSGGKGVSIAAIVFAALVLFAAGYSSVAPGDALAEFESSSVAEEYNIDEDLAKAAINAGLDEGNIEVTSQIGAWLATLAGALALAGSIMGVARSKQIKASQAATTTPVQPAAPPPTAPPTV